MFFGLFEKFSSTSDPSSRKSKFSPIIVKDLSNNVFDRIVEKLETDGFHDIVANKDYLDVMAIQRGFELSIQVTQNGLESIIEMNVFGENKRGRTRRFLKTYYLIFKEMFNQ